MTRTVAVPRSALSQAAELTASPLAPRQHRAAEAAQLATGADRGPVAGKHRVAIGRIGRQFVHQPAMGDAQVVVRDAGEQVVQGVVAQAQRKEQFSGQPVARQVDRVGQLLGVGHLIARVAIAVGRQVADVIEPQDENGQDVHLHEPRPREQAQEDHGRTCRPRAASTAHLQQRPGLARGVFRDRQPMVEM